MKVSAFFFVLFFLLQFSVSISAQNQEASALPARIARIKSDILQEIQTLKSSDQAFFYSQLGSFYWINNDRKEGIYWLTKGVEIGINPATDYQEDNEKLSRLSGLLSKVSEKNAVLEEKLITKIKEIKIDESNAESLEKANKTYIWLAQELLDNPGTENLAFEFAMLSLKGKKPVIDNNSEIYFWKLKTNNEKLADSYFAKALEAVRLYGDKETIWALLNLVESEHRRGKNLDLSDAQKRNYLETLLLFIQKEAEELKLRQRNDCISTRSFGLKYLEDYKRLLPEKSFLIDQALVSCQNSDIEPENKPFFYKNGRQLRTSQDYLDLSKEVKNKQLQTNYLRIAAQLAREQGDYEFSDDILEMVEKDYRQWWWNGQKIEVNASWANRLFDRRDYAGVTKILQNAAELRPFIIVKSLDFVWSRNPSLAQKEFLLNYMNQARADFNKTDKFQVNPIDLSFSPGDFAHLTQFYFKFGFYDEAIISHDESIKYLNRYYKALPSEYKNRAFRYFGAFSTFSNQSPPSDADFLNRNFERVYENIGKIEYPQTRIHQRIYLLSRNLKIASETASATNVSKTNK